LTDKNVFRLITIKNKKIRKVIYNSWKVFASCFLFLFVIYFTSDIF
jgi:hypothetical protein